MKTYFTIFTLFIFYNCSAQYNFSALDSLFQKKASVISGNGGGVTTVLIKNGKQIYNKSIGDFNIDKQVPIASASKWYSATLIMCLVHEGKLSLNDKVSKYIPSFKVKDKENITIRQCFSLTTGFAGSSETLDEFMGNRLAETYPQMVDAIAATPLIASPGSQINYGGIGMQVAGRVAEIVTGKSWNQLFKEKIVLPLGLTNTEYGGAKLGAVPRIAGGVKSTAADYLKLLEMIFNNGVYKGKTILSAKEINIMLVDQTNNASIGYSPFTKYKKIMKTTNDPRYGIGNWVVADENIAINVSPGAFGFTPWIDRVNGYYGLIAIKSSFPKVMPVFWEALNIINQQLDKNK